MEKTFWQKLWCKHKYEEWGTESNIIWDRGEEKPEIPQMVYKIFRCTLCGKEKKYLLN